jgi:hypothetical protein
VRHAIPFVLLALAIAAAAVMVNLVLLGSTSSDPVGKLKPVALLPRPPVTVPTTTTVITTTTPSRHDRGGGQDD